MSEAVYRRSGMRKFFKTTNTQMIMVVNQFKFSTVIISEEPFHFPDVYENKFMKEISASEFDEAFNIAMERIKNQTI